MISAHPTCQIFVDLVICPYCSMGEESMIKHLHCSVNISIINPFAAKIENERWAYTPWFPNMSFHFIINSRLSHISGTMLTCKVHVWWAYLGHI